MSEVTNPERMITTRNGDERPLRDVDYIDLPNDVRKHFERIDDIRVGPDGWMSLVPNAIAAQEGFEPGFVAKTAIKDGHGMRLIDAREDYASGEYNLNLTRAEHSAYQEKSIRELLDKASAEDPEKEVYIRKHLPEHDTIEEAKKSFVIATYADKLYGQTQAQEQGWTPERLYEAMLEVDRIKRSISTLEQWCGIQDPDLITPRGEIYDSLENIASKNTATYGIWKANTEVRDEYEKAREAMMSDPSTTVGDLRNIVRVWLEHTPRDTEDGGQSEGLLYSLRLDQAWTEARLQAIMNETFAEEFAQQNEAEE